MTGYPSQITELLSAMLFTQFKTPLMAVILWMLTALLDNLKVVDNETFLKLYTSLSSINTTTAAKVFGKSKPFTKRNEPISNPVIKSIVSDIWHIGGAIRYEKSNHKVHVSLKAMEHHA